MQAAYHQLQTYKQLIPSLFVTNALMIISDGWFAKVGGLSSEYSRFMEWKTADGRTLVDPNLESALVPMIQGLLNKRTLLDVIRHFIVFEKTRDQTIKKIAAYHQYYAVNRAIESTLRAAADVPQMVRQEAGSIRSALRRRSAARATSAPAWSGIRKAAARASPWSSTPAS